MCWGRDVRIKYIGQGGPRGGRRLSAGLKEVKGPAVTSEGKSEKENNTRRDPDGETLLAHTESGRKASLPGSRRPRRK